MRTVTRFAPFRDSLRLQGELDRLFQRASFANGEQPAAWAPPVDIFEGTEGITLTAELPGFAPEEIELLVENDTLTLKGERKLEKAEARDNYRRVERRYGTFARSFALPPTVDAAGIKADSKNGVLTVFLPRREESRPKQIKVKVEA